MTVLSATLAVFAVITLGALLRRTGLLTHDADTSLMKLVVWVLIPALIVDSILDSTAFGTAANVWLPPLLGFATAAAGIAIAGAAAWALGPALGLRTPRARRTFALAAGLHNYGYLPIPLARALHPDADQQADVLGVLFVTNVGVELALWTLGVAVVSGSVGWSAVRRVVNPPAVAVVAALALLAAGGRGWIPGFLDHALGTLAGCAVPVALLMIGALIVDAWARGRTDPDHSARDAWATALGGSVLRLGLLPLVFVAAAAALPWIFAGPADAARPLHTVLVLHAAMPGAIFPIVIARFYGGEPAVAARVAIATSALSLVTMPLWIAALKS